MSNRSQDIASFVNFGCSSGIAIYRADLWATQITSRTLSTLRIIYFLHMGASLSSGIAHFTPQTQINSPLKATPQAQF